MKWILTITAGLLLGSAGLQAADNGQVISLPANAKTPAGSFVDSITVSPYGVVRWPNVTDAPEYGAGLDVGVKVNSFVAVHVLNTAYHADNWGGSAIDETSLLVSADITKFKTESFTPYFIGGGSRDWERSDWGFQAGLGARINFNKHVSVGADYSLRAWFNNDKDGVLRGYLQASF